MQDEFVVKTTDRTDLVSFHVILFLCFVKDYFPRHVYQTKLLIQVSYLTELF